MKMILLVLLLAFGTSKTYAGGNHAGNGGNAVVCYNDASLNTISSIEFFDFWEQPQRQKWGSVALGPADLPITEKILIATRRVAKFDPNLAGYLEKQAVTIALNIQTYFNEGSPLPTVFDANPLVEPKKANCFREQLAIQYKDVQTGQRRFVISRQFYNHPAFSTDSKVGMILHEAIYRYAILRKDEKNSDGVRLFNYFIASKILDDPHLSINEYLAVLKKARLEKSECIEKVSIFMIPREFAPYEGTSCYNQNVKVGAVELQIPANSKLTGIWGDERGFSILSPHPQNLVDVQFIDNYSNIFQFQSYSITVYSPSKTDPFKKLQMDVSPLFNRTKYPSIYGPLNTFYPCKRISIHSVGSFGEIKNCHLLDEFKQFKVISKENLNTTSDSNYWAVLDIRDIATKEPFTVLGSKKGLSFKDMGIVRNSYSDETSIIIDQDLNVVSGAIYQGSEQNTPILINEIPFYVDWFEVENKKGIYHLKFGAHTRFKNPRYKTLRLTTSNSENAIKKYCNTLGHADGRIIENLQEYISAKGEQLYDISTQQVVYKTDEDTNVVTEIYCFTNEMETKDY